MSDLSDRLVRDLVCVLGLFLMTDAAAEKLSEKPNETYSINLALRSEDDSSYFDPDNNKMVINLNAGLYTRGEEALTFIRRSWVRSFSHEFYHDYHNHTGDGHEEGAIDFENRVVKELSILYPNKFPNPGVRDGHVAYNKYRLPVPKEQRDEIKFKD